MSLFIIFIFQVVTYHPNSTMISVNGGDKMSYRYDMQGKSSQAQAIVRKRDAEDKLRKEEYKKKQNDAERIEKAERLIIDFLSEQTEPQSLNDIVTTIDSREVYVIPALINLERKRSINTLDMINKVSGLESTHYLIKKVDTTENK